MADASSNRHGWSAARRARQAEVIRSWRPWERSTGPRTPAGKRRSALNGSRRKSAASAVEEVLRRLIAAGFLNAAGFETPAGFSNESKGRR